MKVDANGNPVSVGSYGLRRGVAARVERILAEPGDSIAAQKILTAGGYLMDLGEDGKTWANPKDFVLAPHANNVVLTQDGKEIHKGDWVTLADDADLPEGHEEGKKYKVANVYPLEKLGGFACISLEDSSSGGARDGKWGIGWGKVLTVVERGVDCHREELEVVKSGHLNATVSSPEIVPVTVPLKNDLIQFVDDENNRIMTGRVIIEANEEEGEVQALVIDCSAMDQGGDPEVEVTGPITTLIYLHVPETVPLQPNDLVEIAYGTPEKGEKKGLCRVISRANQPDLWRARGIIGILPWDEDALAYLTKRMLTPHKKEVFFDVLEQKWVKAYAVSPEYIEKKMGHVKWKEGQGPKVEEDGEFNNGELGNTLDAVLEEQCFTTSGKGEKTVAATKGSTKIDIERSAETKRIIVPEGMSTRTIIKELTRQAEQEELDVNIMEIIDGHVLDAAHALVQFLAKKFGWVNALPTPGFFGPTPPTMIGVKVDPEGNTVQIPWGQLGIPGLSGKLATGVQMQDGRPVFCLQGTIKQKDKFIVNEIANGARQYLKDGGSIYKGRAIKVKFPKEGEEVFSPLDHQPQFIPTAEVKPDELIFSEGVEKQVSVNIWTPIRNLAAVKAAKVPLKRGVLLYGRYGVGKTLLAHVTARMAVQAGVTFIDLVDSNQLPQAIQFARQLGGMVVIFAEDIDRCDNNGERSDAFNNILNTVDGLTSKTDEVLIVYTTNHIERISKAMLRQGRIDKVIHIKEPDSQAAQRLVRLYARHLLKPSENIEEVGDMLRGFIPAAIREVVEQSKLAAIERGDVHGITASDLKTVIENTREHMDLLKETPADDRSEFEKFGVALGQQIGGSIADLVARRYGLDEEEAEAERKVINEVTTAPARRLTRAKVTA